MQFITHPGGYIQYSEIPACSLRRLSLALFLSVLFHLAILAGVFVKPQTSDIPLEVNLLVEPKLSFAPAARSVQQPEVSLPLSPPKQIVSESEAPDGKPPDAIRLRAERDSVTAQEKIQRGFGAQKNEAPPTSQSALHSPPEKSSPPPAAKAASAAAPRSRAAAITSLRPDDLAEQIAARDNAAGLQAKNSENAKVNSSPSSSVSEKDRAREFEQYQPFRRNTSSGIFSDRAGIPDYLPSIPDGDITLLNAKADRHAIFVRRVALQVFGALRRMSWAEIPFKEINTMTGFVTVEAIMNNQGHLIRIKLEQSSGVHDFDNVLSQAVREGAWDQNPPVKAGAEDGNIHFIFQSRTWARQRGDAIREQRWLLLGTGLL